jgi:hypothetical protein
VPANTGLENRQGFAHGRGREPKVQPVADYSEEEWEGIGTRWREAAGLNGEVRMDAPSFIRWLKRIGYIKDYVCVSTADLPTCEGKFEPEERRIYYRQATWRGAEQENPHDVWTLVHEASHAILKHGETRLRASSPDKAVRSRRGAKDEVDANRLTASLLAPFDKADFKPGMTADDISGRFGFALAAEGEKLEVLDLVAVRRSGTRILRAGE